MVYDFWHHNHFLGFYHVETLCDQPKLLFGPKLDEGSADDAISDVTLGAAEHATVIQFPRHCQGVSPTLRNVITVQI